ncbi:MAG: hypothetical protein MST12_03375 [Spirochaetia bacterium]|uniref:hypothetical protein n=1 Tax=Treponema sp. TaxID=166 RepID=UPI00298EA8D1|nr:hypothetical protein [Treponema sp.]MCI7398606.1 hypothetical protein [Spirochaetia bacterium]MCI7577275.1 hypothetical protein [Spirochaetia bacterium]
MADDKEMELISVLNEQERILDSMLDEQSRIHECVVKRSWEGLEQYVMTINELGGEFSRVDNFRDRIASVSDDIYFKPEVKDVFLRVKNKLSKSKIENDALAKYVNATKAFISEVMDNCISQQRNDIYSSNGTMRKNYAQSIVINRSV